MEKQQAKEALKVKQKHIQTKKKMKMIEYQFDLVDLQNNHLCNSIILFLIYDNINGEVNKHLEVDPKSHQ